MCYHVNLKSPGARVFRESKKIWGGGDKKSKVEFFNHPSVGGRVCARSYFFPRSGSGGNYGRGIGEMREGKCGEVIYGEVGGVQGNMEKGSMGSEGI